jgi:hypothetical protein
MEKNCSWEDEEGWILLQKWFHSSCDISVSSGDLLSDTHFAMNRGLITHLDPLRIRIRGEDGREWELPLSESDEQPEFEDVVSARMMAETPEVTGKFPEMVTVVAKWERWRFVGPIELEGKVKD